MLKKDSNNISEDRLKKKKNIKQLPVSFMWKAVVFS